MDWFRDHVWETWLIAGAALAVVEMLTLDLIFGMLAVGAGVGLVAAVLGAPVVLQFVLALASAVGLLAFMRPSLLRRLHGGPDLITGPAKLIGAPVHVLTAMGPGRTGRVKLDGEEWTAAPYDELDELDAGERAEVVEIRGATAYIRRA
ncbi:membrane protein [Marmoricola endophyticus]|uniref:Membrane protein n=1 Tax=Marmoricola endophyticus TaxID=2040280 RepID=A0A917F1N7_9ACTN|nr:NfeD family protein [Marmoricola endophyticus]GGF34000.1 membrane protein [Marmoricola endophyticus]